MPDNIGAIPQETQGKKGQVKDFISRQNFIQI